MDPRTREVVIGNGLLLAPLAGIADVAMRVVARHLGAGPLMTEMISAHGVCVGRERLLTEQLALLELQRPLAVQFVGSEPKMMAEASKLAESLGADSINLNMACPARKVVKTGKGCGMMRDVAQSVRVMEAVRNAVEIPVTVKIRAGWCSSSINAIEFAKAAEGAGMAAVVLHPRTRQQAFSGQADWQLIAAVKQAASLPIIGNGDIRRPEDARRMLESTGCDAVMVGRGALGRPWLFALMAADLGIEVAPMPGLVPLCAAALENRDPVELGKLARLHVELALRVGPSEECVAKAMRKHLIWYSKGLPRATVFRSAVHTITDASMLESAMQELFA
jgi:tRNA-dihydrouridine synthase B